MDIPVMRWIISFTSELFSLVEDYVDSIDEKLPCETVDRSDLPSR